MEEEKIKQLWLQEFLIRERGFKQKRKSGACKWGLFHFPTEANTGEEQRTELIWMDELRAKNDGARKAGNL